MNLNEVEIDALTEVINIGAGRAACCLSELTGSQIELKVPHIHIVGCSDFCHFAEKLELNINTTIQQKFEGEVSGRALLAFPQNSAIELAAFVGDIDDSHLILDEEISAVLEEIGNIILNAVLGSIANILDCELTYTIPELCKSITFDRIVSQDTVNKSATESVAVIADASFTIASKKISGSLLLLFEMGNIERLLNSLIATTNN